MTVSASRWRSTTATDSYRSTAISGDDLAELGEVVSAGDDIGKTGKTSLFEFDSPDHLHFEMRKDGEPVDPGDYIDF